MRKHSPITPLSSGSASKSEIKQPHPIKIVKFRLPIPIALFAITHIAAHSATAAVMYHDFGAFTGQASTGNITTHQVAAAPTALDTSTKALINYADGLATGVIFSVNQGNGMDPRNGGETGPPAAATPADALFNVPGLNLNNGLFFVGNNTAPGRFDDQTITLTGLNPALLYDLALYGHRNATADAVERFTLGGADAAVNSSSIGIQSTFVTDMETRPNQTTGNVVRWTGVNPGADGMITVLVDPGFDGETTNISYLSAMRLEAVPEPSSALLLGFGALVWQFRRRRK
jgi:hypothetical protein